jgi:hypothetical protein
MADRVTDLWFAFSGNVTYADGRIGTIECYYDSNAGAYSPSTVEGLSSDAQLLHSASQPSDYGIDTAAATWFQELQWFFMTAMATDTGPTQSIVRNPAVNPAVPSPLRTVTDYTLHVRGVVAFADGDHSPVSGTWTAMAKPGGGASHVDNATNEVFTTFVWESADEWTTLLESAFSLVILNAQIA